MFGSVKRVIQYLWVGFLSIFQVRLVSMIPMIYPRLQIVLSAFFRRPLNTGNVNTAGTAYKRWEALRRMKIQTINRQLRQDYHKLLYPYLIEVEGAQGRVNLVPLFQVLVFLTSIFLFVRWAVAPSVSVSSSPYEDVYLSTPSFFSSRTAVPFSSADDDDDDDFSLGVSVTPSPSSTPVVVVVTPSWDIISDSIVMGRFSFYDPDVGKDFPEIRYINCALWDDVSSTCLSTLRNGAPWQDNYFKVAACTYDLYLARAEFLVLSPDWLREIVPSFVCADTGEAVTGLFFDFLIPWRSIPFSFPDGVPWGSPIALIRVK